MRLSIARVSAADGHTPGDTVNRDDIGFDVRGATWRRMAVALAAALVLGCVGILFATPSSAGADTPTVFQSGQVFASVGNSTVYAFDPASGDQVATLQDDTDEPYTAGKRVRRQRELLRHRRLSTVISVNSAPPGLHCRRSRQGCRTLSRSSSTTRETCTSASSQRPTSQSSRSDGTRLPDIGPLQTELYGDDWIDLSSDECTFYYTTEGTDILTYNKCTDTQGPDFNKVPFPSSIRRPASPSTRSSSRSLPTAMCWSPIRTPSSCWTRTGTSCRRMPARPCPTVAASSSPSASTRAARRSGPEIPRRGTSIRSTSQPAR